jgi:lipoprotein-anchoring transpeptidase ErfK/SrfK
MKGSFLRMSCALVSPTVLFVACSTTERSQTRGTAYYYAPVHRSYQAELQKTKGGAAAAPAKPNPLTSKAAVDSFWRGEELSGSPRIKINLSEQKAYFYKGDKLAGVSPVSTGRNGFRTPTGTYKIQQKNPSHRSNLYGAYVDAGGNVVRRDVDVRKDPRPSGTRFKGAPMPYFMRIHGGVGMHAGYVPNYPASHGCIRLPKHMAQAFFAHAPVGTTVQVVN